MEFFGYNPPFFGGHQNVMSRQAGDRLIKNDILQLLLTVPGERVMRPTWGTLIKPSVFDNIDDSAINALRGSISSALSTYETRVLLGISITTEEDGTVLRIRLEGEFTNEPNHTFEDELLLPIMRAES